MIDPLYFVQHPIFLHDDHHMKVKRPMPRPKPAVDPRVERSRQVLLLAGREWLAGAFSLADILMADVLRLVDRFDGLAGTSRLS
jgi:glutathione S-transferase